MPASTNSLLEVALQMSSQDRVMKALGATEADIRAWREGVEAPWPQYQTLVELVLDLQAKKIDELRIQTAALRRDNTENGAD